MDAELREEFARINLKLDAMAGLKETVAALNLSFDKHTKDDKEFLIGEGDAPGLVIKVDRLERSWASHQRFFWLLVTAVTGMLAEGVWRLLEHLK